MKGTPILIAVALIAAGSLAGCVRSTDTGTGTVTRVDVESTPQVAATQTAANRSPGTDTSEQAPATVGK